MELSQECGRGFGDWSNQPTNQLTKPTITKEEVDTISLSTVSSICIKKRKKWNLLSSSLSNSPPSSSSSSSSPYICHLIWSIMQLVFHIAIIQLCLCLMPKGISHISNSMTSDLVKFIFKKKLVHLGIKWKSRMNSV